MMESLRISARVLLVFTLLTGVIYPLAITGAAQLLFPRTANGNLILEGGAAKGSALIGQPFDDAGYFWSRPSATAPNGYNATASSGGNLAVGNPDQLKAIADRVARLRQADSGNREPVPADLVTASGSGLDPHISPAAARFQMGRVARSRGLNAETVGRLIDEQIEQPQWGVFGSPRVNVLRLNLALDGLEARHGAR